MHPALVITKTKSDIILPFLIFFEYSLTVSTTIIMQLITV